MLFIFYVLIFIRWIACRLELECNVAHFRIIACTLQYNCIFCLMVLHCPLISLIKSVKCFFPHGSINTPHFYSAAPQGYFLLFWIYNAVLSCALMLIWKFDALHTWFSPHHCTEAKTSFSLLHTHLIWHPSCSSALCVLLKPPGFSLSFHLCQSPLLLYRVQNFFNYRLMLGSVAVPQ